MRLPKKLLAVFVLGIVVSSAIGGYYLYIGYWKAQPSSIIGVYDCVNLRCACGDPTYLVIKDDLSVECHLSYHNAMYKCGKMQGSEWHPYDDSRFVVVQGFNGWLSVSDANGNSVKWNRVPHKVDLSKSKPEGRNFEQYCTKIEGLTQAID